MLLPLLLYALLGLVVEVIYTACYAAAEAVVEQGAIDSRLQGHTYLWMMPIYGFGGLLFELIHRSLLSTHWTLRGLVYVVGIFVVEYLAGWLIERLTGTVPWDYSNRRWHIHGKIRLDYAPVWFCFGLFLEHASGWVHGAASGILG
jgi:uncharacterized membrane protein